MRSELRSERSVSWRREGTELHGDWPVSSDVVSHQASHCGKHKGSVWLALDPDTLAASAAVLEEARAAFTTWKTAGVNKGQEPVAEG